MSTLASALLPPRFLLLVLHLVATGCLIYTRIPLLKASLDIAHASSGGTYSQKEDIFLTLLSMAVLCFAMELVFLMSGFDLQQCRLHLTSTLLHAVGLVMTLWMILNQASADNYPMIFVLCSVVPCSLDLGFAFKQSVVSRGTKLQYDVDRHNVG
ncbi:unnamed protein product [Chrysoparadoxa australica]